MAAISFPRIAAAGLAAAAAVAAAGSAVQAAPGDVVAPVAALATANGVAITAPIDVVFSESVRGVGATSVQLLRPGSTVPVAARVTASAPRWATVRPSSPLVPGETYRLVVTSGVTDLAGNAAVLGARRSVRTSQLVAAGSPALRETWDADSDANAFGRGYAKSATTGASSSFAFTGTSFALYAQRTPVGGNARVYLDDTFVGVIDFYAARVQWRSRVFHRAVPPGRHQVTLRVTGTSRRASGGAWVYIDRWSRWSDGWTSYEEAANETSVAVADRWSRLVATDAATGVVGGERLAKNSHVDGSPTIHASVVGAGVTVLLCRGPSGGIANVYVDGTRRASVDLYGSWSRCGARAFTTRFPNGEHDVGVRVTDIVPSNSRGSWVGFDSLLVR